MNKQNDEALNLRNKLDALTRQLEARVREFKERGEFSDLHEPFLERIRKHQAIIKEKLESAIDRGITWDLIKYEVERDFNGLIEDIAQGEKRLDAETMKQAGKHT